MKLRLLALLKNAKKWVSDALDKIGEAETRYLDEGQKNESKPK